MYHVSCMHHHHACVCVCVHGSAACETHDVQRHMAMHIVIHNFPRGASSVGRTAIRQQQANYPRGLLPLPSRPIIQREKRVSIFVEPKINYYRWEWPPQALPVMILPQQHPNNAFDHFFGPIVFCHLCSFNFYDQDQDFLFFCCSLIYKDWDLP